VITVYGRMPVLEALLDRRAVVEQLIVARSARGESVERILAAAAARNVRVERADAHRVTRISRNGRHDQGVVADVASPRLAELDEWLAAHPSGAVALIVLDGLTNPANAGMIIRSAVGAGLDGVVLPRAGSPEVGPLVVKASAGIALWAPIMRVTTAAEAARALMAAEVTVMGLRAGQGQPLWEAEIPERVALVVGNETDGVSPRVASLASSWCTVPLAGGVESLNVASAAAVVAFELARRRSLPAGEGIRTGLLASPRGAGG